MARKRFVRRRPRTRYDGGRPRRRRRYVSRIRRRLPKTFPLSMAPSIIVPVGHILGGRDGVHGGLIMAAKTGDPQWIAHEVVNIVPYETIGYKWDGTWDFGIIAQNAGLIIGGVLIHSLANRLGANRYMKRIPFIGKYVSL